MAGSHRAMAAISVPSGWSAADCRVAGGADPRRIRGTSRFAQVAAIRNIRRRRAELIPDADLKNQMLMLLGLNESDLGSFPSNTESGFAGTLEIEGLRRISDTRWHWGGYARGRISPEFDNFGDHAGLALWHRVRAADCQASLQGAVSTDRSVT